MPAGSPRPTAGRPKGGHNRKTEEAVALAEAGGETPLAVLLRLMRTSADLATIIDCAKAAAPYVHARLSNVDAKIDGDLRQEFSWLA